MIPVIRTQLPRAQNLLPYLEMIDNSHIYSNYGPLVEKLTHRLAEYLGLEPDSVVLLSNATVAIEGAIINSTNQEDSDEHIKQSKEEIWYVPSFTFPATVHALIRSSKECRFTDVDDQWNTVPCSKFGIDVLQFGDIYIGGKVNNKSNYQNYDKKIIDAAGSFDACFNIAPKLNMNDGLVISFHATKTFSTGEGGLFASKDKDWVQRVRQWSNFGLWGSREAKIAGTNAKMSEYAAAVGLAFFDEWDEYREKLRSIKHIAQNISARFELNCSPSFKTEFISNYWVIELNDLKQKTKFIEHMESMRIETREWWANGCHSMPAFKSVKCEKLTKTSDLVNKVVGLPMGIHLKTKDFTEIVKALESFKF